jgi:hypothetical protein
MVRAAVVLLLALLAAKMYAVSVFDQPGIDFYHFWGVPTALKLSGHRLSSPYRQRDQYAEILNEHAGAGPGDRLLARANRERRSLDLTGSPLVYTAFAVLPQDYSTALGLFRGVMVVAFLATTALLGTLYRHEPFLAATLGLALLITADPYKNDLSLGNINILLLCGLACCLAAMHALLGQPRQHHLVVSSGILTGLSALTLLKPLVLLPCLALAVGLCMSHRRGAMLRSLGLAVVPTLGLLLLPCLYFGSWTVWGDWYQAVYGADHRRLFYPTGQGNFSFALLASDRLGVHYLPLAAGLAIALVVSFIVVAATAGRPAATGRSCHIQDPHLLVSVGLVATFALSPLAWVHYYLLFLIPALWLTSLSARSLVIGFLGLTSLVMSSGAADYAFLRLQQDGLIPWVRALSWLPAWIGILVAIRGGQGGRTGRANPGMITESIGRSDTGGLRPTGPAGTDPAPT